MTVEKAIAKFKKGIYYTELKIDTSFRIGRPSTSVTFESFSSKIEALSEELSERVEELTQFYLDKDMHESEEFSAFVSKSSDLTLRSLMNWMKLLALSLRTVPHPRTRTILLLVMTLFAPISN